MKFEMKALIWGAGILLFGCSEETLHNSSSTQAITDADIAFHISYLASDALEGREAGSRGARAAGDYLASEFNHFGLEPAGTNGSYFHEFEVIAGVKPGAGNGLALQTADSTINGVFQQDFTCLAFTGNGALSGGLVFAGYGIEAPKLHYDDYENLDVQGKIVLVLRNTPEGDTPHSDFYDYAPFRRKAAVARDKGAKAILFVTGEKNDPEDALVALRYDRTPSRAGIGVAQIKRRLAERLFAGTGKSLPEVQDAIDAAKKPASFAFGGVQARLGRAAVRCGMSRSGARE